MAPQVGHAIAVHGHAVQVGGAGELDRDVQITADEHVAENLVHRWAELGVEAHLAQHWEDILAVGILAVAVLQAVEGEEGDATSLVLVEVLNDLGRDVIVVHHHVEQLIGRGSLHGGKEALIAIHELDERAVHLNTVILRDALHRVEPAKELARHRELEVLIPALHFLRLRAELGVEFGVAPLQFLAFVLRRVPRRNFRIVLLLRLPERCLLLHEHSPDGGLVPLFLLNSLPEFPRVSLKDGDLVAFAAEG